MSATRIPDVPKTGSGSVWFCGAGNSALGSPSGGRLSAGSGHVKGGCGHDWPLSKIKLTHYRLATACALLAALAALPLHAQSYQDLYDFDCALSGCYPYGTLTQGRNGNLYGTAQSGGSKNLGTIFMVSPAGTGYTVLWNFESTTGAGGGGLTLSSLDGNFYGTTNSGVTGTLFQFSPFTNAFNVMHTFSSTEGIPVGPPVEAKDGNLYGLASLNSIGSTNGTAYRLTVSTGVFELLPKPVPGDPAGPLLLASDGYLYGATETGGSKHAGVVFRMTTAGAIEKIYTFTDGDDGSTPNAPLAQGKDGNLYGTAGAGGFYGDGTIFELTLPSYGFATVDAFEEAGGGGGDPDAGLLAASDGNFYGTTYLGGTDGIGTIFEMAGGTFIPLFDFSGQGGTVSGGSPTTTLMEDTNGMFYGLTSAYGANLGGVLYTFTPPHPTTHISLCCIWWVILDQPVTILGQNLTGVVNVYFGSVPAQFRHGSDTYLIADVPSAAIDGPVSVTLATGLQVESAQSVHILPKITGLDPSSGPLGAPVSIVGGGFAGATKVTFGGVAATNVTVVSPALIQATVPPGATTGKVEVVTPNGSAKSKKTFTVN
jgi:uncharacterized repeat protein (TIGR03803 family)